MGPLAVNADNKDHVLLLVFMNYLTQNFKVF
jgi:hypothetical protein